MDCNHIFTRKIVHIKKEYNQKIREQIHHFLNNILYLFSNFF